MENGKFNFINFGHALGRSEMKKLMAGSGAIGCSDYDHFCIDNPHGQCAPEDTGAHFKSEDCLLACIPSNYYVYCGGFGGGCS